MVDSRENDGFVDMSDPAPEGPRATTVDFEAALELHPRGTAQILDFGVDVLMRRIVPILGVCALIWLPLRALMPFANRVQTDFITRGEGLETGTAGLILAMTFFFTAIGQLLAAVASVATVTLFVYGDLVGRSITVWDAARGALKRILGLFGVMLITALSVGFVMGGLVLLGFLCPIFLPVAFVAYVYVSWRLAVAPASLVLEDLGVIEAIRRSWDLSKGSFWRWVGVSVLTSFLVSGFSMTIAAIDGPTARNWLAGSIGMPELVITILFVGISAVLAGIATSFSAAGQTVYYLDLRMRRDGLDLLMRLERLNALH